MDIKARLKMLGRNDLNHEAVLRDAANRIEELEKQLDKYKVLTKERGNFIINGEDFGYIRKPTSEIDSAYYTFLRCQMTDEAAAEAV